MVATMVISAVWYVGVRCDLAVSLVGYQQSKTWFEVVMSMATGNRGLLSQFHRHTFDDREYKGLSFCTIRSPFILIKQHVCVLMKHPSFQIYTMILSCYSLSTCIIMKVTKKPLCLFVLLCYCHSRKTNPCLAILYLLLITEDEQTSKEKRGVEEHI